MSLNRSVVCRIENDESFDLNFFLQESDKFQKLFEKIERKTRKRARQSMYMDIDDEVPSKHLATSRSILYTSNCFEKMAEEEPPPPQPPQQEHAAETWLDGIREPNRVI